MCENDSVFAYDSLPKKTLFLEQQLWKNEVMDTEIYVSEARPIFWGKESVIRGNEFSMVVWISASDVKNPEN